LPKITIFTKKQATTALIMHLTPSFLSTAGSETSSIIAFLIGITLLGGFLYHAVKLIWYSLFEHSSKHKASNTKLKQNYLLDALLEKNTHYYTQLPATLKIDFKAQTVRLANRYKWISGSGQPITEEMRLLISASAVQLLFGRPDIKQDYYSTIVVYAEQYFNPMTQKHHKGEVNSKLIVLSYKHFTEGNANPTDKINLGLHEMAHALDLSIFLGHSKRYFMRMLMNKFIKKTYPDFIAMQHQHNNFLRDYGKTNLREFFAVAVEHFFEAPNEMLEQTPIIYRELCLLLNQDPAAGIYRGVHPSRLPHIANNVAHEQLKNVKDIYKSDYSPKLAFPIMMTVAALFIFFGSQTNDHGPAPIISALLFLFSLALAKRYLRRLMIAPNHLIVSTLLNKSRHSIHLSNIIVVSVESNIGSYDFHIAYYEDNQILELTERCYMTKVGLQIIANHLKDLGLTIEVDGRLIK
jgi:Mlc titration factor MtfA (ptsG expression regulator)